MQPTTHPSTPKGWKAESAWLDDLSGRFTHISGHPSAAGRAQDMESSPRNQPSLLGLHGWIYVTNVGLQIAYRCCRCSFNHKVRLTAVQRPLERFYDAIYLLTVYHGLVWWTKALFIAIKTHGISRERRGVVWEVFVRV